MILQLLAAFAALGGLYEWSEEGKNKVQIQKGITPTGIPVTTVVPVIPNVLPLQAHPANYVPAPLQTNYTRPLIPLTTNTPTGFNLSPIVITPTGAANVSVASNQDVQSGLNALNFANPPLVIDGNIGPASQAAIKSFQTANGIPVTGQPDQTTKNALSSALNSMASPNAAIGQNPQVLAATVQSAAATIPIISNKDIQHALNLLGATPALTEDGVIGPMTIAAIKAFQVSHGLLNDGIAGPMVKTALQLALNNPAVQSVVMNGESWDEMQRNYQAKAPFHGHHAYVNPPRTDQNFLEYENDFVDPFEIGIRFDEVQQRLLTDGDTPMAFGDDFGAAVKFPIAPPLPPSAVSRPAPPTGFQLSPPTGLLGSSGGTFVAPPPPPLGSSYVPPPVYGPVQQSYSYSRYPYAAQPGYHHDWRRHQLQADLYSQQQMLANQAGQVAPVMDPSAFDISQIQAVQASAPDPSGASAPIVVPANQTIDPDLVAAVQDATEDAQSGAIDAATGAAASVLMGSEFGAATSKRRHHHKHHSPQSMGDNSDDDFGVAPPPPPRMIAPPPPPGGGMIAPPPPPIYGNSSFPYNGPQGPNRHHHRHHHNQQSDYAQQQQQQAYYPPPPSVYDDDDYGHEADNLANSRTSTRC